MLRRVAESVFWMTRYIERAENIARFVDVNLAISLGGVPQWAPLVYASGDEKRFAELYGEFSTENVLRFLLIDERCPNSILSCLARARENARTIREVLSVSMWEAVNAFYLRVREAAERPALLRTPAAFLERVKRASHEVIGVTEATMSHGDAWNFARIGRLLERADKTSRILDVKYFILLPAPSHEGTTLDVVEWSALLESTSALHMYRKRFGRIVPKSVVEFLVLDPHFPRSIRFCVEQALASLSEITGPHPCEFGDESRRALELVRERLLATQVDSIQGTALHAFVDDFQLSLNELGAAVFREFFENVPLVQQQAQAS